MFTQALLRNAVWKVIGSFLHLSRLHSLLYTAMEGYGSVIPADLWSGITNLHASSKESAPFGVCWYLLTYSLGTTETGTA